MALNPLQTHTFTRMAVIRYLNGDVDIYADLTPIRRHSARDIHRTRRTYNPRG